MRQVLVGLVVLMAVAGCGTRKSSLLLERNARGPIDEALLVAKRFEWHLEPVRQTLTKGNVEVTVNHASREFAGRNPYYLENLVFYIQIANRSDERVFVDPGAFALVDDRGNQYAVVEIGRANV